MAKITRITPVFKSGDKNNLSNYRPISILPTLSKVLERVVYNKLTSYLDKLNIIVPSQYGFRKKNTTYIWQYLTYLIKSMMQLTKATTELPFFLDLFKAFDTIETDILINKLQHYGIRGLALDWFCSYMFGRHQYVFINDRKSSANPSIMGFPRVPS